MKIHCCSCDKMIDARLTDGKEIYPHRKDLWWMSFWKCDTCGNYVGTHHKTKDRTRPLGNIPTPKIRQLRNRIHAIIDPLWKTGKIDRKELYSRISEHVGAKQYHTGNIKTADEARKVLDFAAVLEREINIEGLRVC